MHRKLRVALCQMLVGFDKSQNISKAVAMIQRAACSEKAQVVVLPECFNAPYGTKYFEEYAEPLAAGHPTFDAMSNAAKECGAWIIAGSIPEKHAANGNLYNSCMIFNPEGNLVNVHRKVHLFRINTETVKFDEGEVLTAGDAATVVPLTAVPHEAPDQPAVEALCGVGICFDIRFPQLALRYTQLGTSLMVFPGAFNMVTGPAHWELLAKARAVDGQQHVILCSPARDESAGYVAYGHSLVVDPWGNVLAEAGAGEELVVCDVDLSQNEIVRGKVPALKGVRDDLYELRWK